jgi:uncharacterized cofD-like protein
VAHGEVEVDARLRAGSEVRRMWLEPQARIHPDVSSALHDMDAILIGPGSFYTSLMPTCLVKGVREALEDIAGPVIYIANLLTEGSGMRHFTAAEGARRIADAIGRPVDVVIFNTACPRPDVLARYAVEHKEPMPLGQLDPHSHLVKGPFWTGEYARHDRRRLAYAVWGVLARRLLR